MLYIYYIYIYIYIYKYLYNNFHKHRFAMYVLSASTNDISSFKFCFFYTSMIFFSSYLHGWAVYFIFNSLLSLISVGAAARHFQRVNTVF